MQITITTWNINSVRYRIDLVAEFIKAWLTAERRWASPRTRTRRDLRSTDRCRETAGREIGKREAMAPAVRS